ncbi:MAG: ferrous iron transporter B [Thermoguttaceae bacterium]|nr:ferrous iron transporter B [Thermoguttaceae bacterium]MDW8079478.1 ferrous iron transporter B [Thermoguttaceae bacterium]
MVKLAPSSKSITEPAPIRVALVGNPNCGKSTLFNDLVGLRQRVGNFPGVTVEKKSGFWQEGNWLFELVDLPGVVSLAVASADELITFEVLCGLRPDTPPPDIILLVVDASHLHRQLYLISQVLERGLPTVLVLNMMDLAEEEGTYIQVEELGRKLGVPVVPTVAHRKKGIDQLRQTLQQLVDTKPRPDPGIQDLGFPTVVAEEISKLARLIEAELCKDTFGPQLRESSSGPSAAPCQLQGDQHVLPHASKSSTISAPAAESISPGKATASAPQRPAEPPSAGSFARFLATRFVLDPPSGLVTEQVLPKWWPQISQVVKESRQRLAAAAIDLATLEPDVRFPWVEQLARQVIVRRSVPVLSFTERLDAVLTHPVWGMLFLTVTMLLVFQAIYLLADPLVGILQEGLAWVGWLVEKGTSPGILQDFLVDGLLSGVGTVLSFLPPIALLFLFIGILEDCGYLTRASFLMDRWLAPVGLSGKCFIPLLTCFSCAIPGIMATRVIDDPRDRLKTILIAPLMTCSARLPVFTLMTALLISPGTTLLGGWISLRGLVLASMYFLGVAAAALSAWVFSRTILAGPLGIFIMELPHYKWPDLRMVAFRVTERVFIFLRNAGTVILAASLLVWFLVNFPRNEEVIVNDPTVQELRAKLEETIPGTPEEETLRNELELAELAALQRSSLLGRFGRLIEPVFWPAGWDWRIGCAVLASFPAREVVVANLGVLFRLGEVDPTAGGTQSQRIQQKLLAVCWEGSDRRLFTGPTCLSLMVFFALCVQCASTLIAIARETNSWRWPVFVFVYMTLLAYVAAVITYQAGVAVTNLFAQA